MQAQWALPNQKHLPMSISFSPQLTDNSQQFLNPILGYPICPIIGRYNRGQYKMSDILMHVQFKCEFDQTIQKYKCSNRCINIPQLMLYNIRNIPQVIILNKINLKDAPDVVPESYPVRNEMSFIWCISFGQFGNDFLNYLNHMYILADRLFLQQKLKRQVHYLPIYAYQPTQSGLHNQQVQKGLNFQQYRGEYLSFHLSKGSPAFSPNNMRVGVQGGKIVTSNQPKQQKKQKKKKNWIEKEDKKVQDLKNINENEGKQQKQEIIPNFQELQNENFHKKVITKIDQQQFQDVNVKISQKVNKNIQKEEKHKLNKKPSNNHQGFIHFYTSILLQKDYRIYYHWHIQNQQQQQFIRQILNNSFSLEQFRQNYLTLIGQDPLIDELNSLIFQNNIFT